MRWIVNENVSATLIRTLRDKGARCPFRNKNLSQNRGRDVQPAPNSGGPVLPEQGSGVASKGIDARSC
jgi:hypothetical protein